MEKVKEEKKFIRFFKYDDEYISGWTYFSRSALNIILSFLFIGIYLNSVTAYKRAKSLGHNDAATLWGIWGFLAFPLAFTPIAIISNTIPHWYLWFSNGNLYGNGILSFNELNKSDNFFRLKNELYSGYACIKKGNEITDEFNFIEGKKTLHKSYYKFPIISSQEDWFYENYNEHTNGIINQHRIWHHNGSLTQNIITHKNGEKTEERFNENNSNFIKSEVID